MQLSAVLSAALSALLFLSANATAEPRHAIAMHGEAVLEPGYPHFPYVTPDAPKGGTISYGVQGSFDSLNPFIVQGAAARGLNDLQFGFNVFESLMQRSHDEPFTLYPLLAKSVETDDERTFVEFTLDERARFSDGEPVTPEDVIFTVELLRDKGLPRYATTASKLASIEKVGTRGVRFTFAEGDRELPLILGLMPVLPRHAIDPETFDRSTLKPMTGSGPYRIGEVRPGELLVLERDPHYWARKHPSKIGFDNYDEIRITYYRDANTLFEAFKKGLVDIFPETSPTRWQTGYGFPSVTSGAVTKDVFENRLPSGMLGFVLNTRRAVFEDVRVREALAGLFDFEWSNRNLYGGAYARTTSYFDGSELASSGRPASQDEKALLAPWPDAVHPDIMSGDWKPPVSDGSGRDRAFMRHGFELLSEAGYRLESGRMVDSEGRPLSFEIMLRGANGQEVATVWQRTLRKLGIDARIRSVDDAQYQQRVNTYDYDVIMQRYTSSLSPGVEQVGRFGSATRDLDGTFNFAGVASPAVDGMIRHLLEARERDDFVTAVRAYDRVLLSGFYVVPLYHQPEQWVGRWTRIGRPEDTPLLGPQFMTWWRSPD
ncbi:MAG: extracellular solute-binding protein [Rhizobiaceae bacterium]|nr:extracellular solute-binding protein [Rhizobiaceae bacterium]MCV0406377.1 extracellular solute-binding protein [Rhizobiaceae bacterium]